MRKKLFVLAFSYLLVLLFLSNSYAQCQGDNGLALTIAYSNVFAWPDNLPNFVNTNVQFFRSNGGSIICGRQFVHRLRQGAIACPTYNQIYNQAVTVTGNAGLPHMAPDLAAQMYNYNTDLSLLASYIEELINVCPEIVNGNLVPYHNSNIYRISYALLTGMQQLLLPQHVLVIQRMTYDMNMWYVGNLMNSM